MKNTDGKNTKTRLIGTMANETLMQEKAYKRILRVLFVSCLFLLMIFSCTCIFLRKNYISVNGNTYVGVVSTRNFTGAKPCDLLKIKKIESVYELKQGDLVYYSTSIESGVCEFVKSDKSVITLKNDAGDTFIVNFISVKGVQVSDTPVVGLFVWFVTGVAGALVSAFMILTYVLYLTFRRINYENTEHGKYLLSEYRKWKEDLKHQKLLSKIDGVDRDFVEILARNFQKNNEKFDEFYKTEKISAQEKYKHILFNIHENLIEKQNLTIDEKRVISSIIELLGRAEHIDGDIEYMVVDLILKCRLVSFETDEFVKLSSQFLEGKIDKQDLLNFGSILYILLKRNPILILGKFRNLAQIYLKKSAEFDDDAVNFAKNLMIGIKI